ncbi:MAG TPA: PhzF family phenazine biosynthesis protein [Pyrinomonadaceae bacterium]|jgi:trans-2,3-dihydro-3-hydroxyanthranilate isomerase|nr:PhzF family phenazine biosynthesis protein [Pyrinomonadaceae bacterium]
MMTTPRIYPYLQLDVFTNRALEGNPLAVFPDGIGISDREMQRIAREMNLSETVFVLPPVAPKALRKLRIFTPARELPFAGHPVVGTWNALATLGVVPPPAENEGSTRVYQELGIGVLPVDVEFKNGAPANVVMTQGPFELGPVITDQDKRAEIAAALGLDAADLHASLPIRTMSTGVPYVAVPLRDFAALERARVINDPLGAMTKSLGALGCYLFSTETKDGSDSGAHARMFVADEGIGEDPATGSAGGPLGGYLVYHDALEVAANDGVFRFVVEQGDFIDRPSRLRLEVRGAPHASIDEVRVGGPSVIVARAELILPG